MADYSSPPHLLGSYAPPAVRKGDRVWCRYRRLRCRVTSWTDAPLTWPRCQPIGLRGGSGLRVSVALQQAVLTESAATLAHGWGLSETTAREWRRRFKVGGHAGTPGTRASQRKASLAGRWRPRTCRSPTR